MNWLALLVALTATTGGWTPLRTAASNGDVKAVKLLLLLKPSDLNATEAGQHTPLHVAVFDGRTEATRLLIERGANVNAPDVCGWTPLHTAANRGEKAATELLIA